MTAANDPARGAPGDSDAFALMHGGLVYRIQHRLGLLRGEPPRSGVRALIAVGVTFLPLAVLAAWQGVLWGDRVALPLLADLTVYARFLFAIPMFLFAEVVVDRKLSIAVRYLRASKLFEGGEGAKFEAAIARLRYWRDSVLPEVVLLAVAFGFAWIGRHLMLDSPVSTWLVTTPHLESTVTLAGRWLDLVSAPIYQFMVLLWLWRMLLWGLFLRRVASLDMKLVPTHPDGAAGLGVLGTAQSAFAMAIAALSAAVTARGVQWVQLSGGTATDLRAPLIAFVVLAVLIVLGPLLVFMPRLLETKHRGLLEYGVLAADYTGRFDRKWVRGPRPDEPLLGTADIQSLADLSNSFGVIDRMRVVPVGLREAIGIVVSAALPMLPFLAAIVPVEEILKQLLQFVIR